MYKNPIFVCCSLLILGLFGLVQVKMFVHQLDNEVTELKKNKSSLVSEMKVLKAEWHYLTREERLEALSKKYLKVEAPSKVYKIEDFYTEKKKEAKNVIQQKIIHVSHEIPKWNLKSRDKILSKVKGLKNIGGHGIIKTGG
ncbi:MAG: hypothetical protein RLN62_01715 [Rickettsiales bacterium]